METQNNTQDNELTIKQESSNDSFDDLVKNNKNKIFTALKFFNVHEVTVSYNGYGDSGAIEDVCFFESKNDNSEIEPSVIESWQKIKGLKEVESWSWNWAATTRNEPVISVEEDKEITEAIKDLCYMLLEADFPGWEINSGSNGNFVFDVKTKKIKWEHNNIIESTETSEKEI